MASKQESVSDWMELAKAYSKAEKETVQPYFFVSIEDTDTKERLYSYDLPRDMFWKYQWVIRWRMARLQCQRPKHNICQYLSGYDKKTGLEIGLKSPLSKLTSAKAQVTINERKLKDYLEGMKNDLFFDEKTDPIVAKLKCKISSYNQQIQELENVIQTKVKTLHNENSNGNNAVEA